MSNQTSDSSAPIIETFTVKRRYLTEREVEQACPQIKAWHAERSSHPR
jgi:hypothetical protein